MIFAFTLSFNLLSSRLALLFFNYFYAILQYLTSSPATVINSMVLGYAAADEKSVYTAREAV